MATPLLSAALIVKDEESFLPECLDSLNSLRPLLGEICVYDTGSTDRTVEIAEAAGSRVERGYWNGDFARARNAAIHMCSCKWTLIIDADERVVARVPRLAELLRAAAKTNRGSADALTVLVADLRGGVFEQAWPSQRILRRGRARYEGAVHESVVSTRPGAELQESALPDDAIVLQHLGYETEEARNAKSARNLRLSDELIATLELQKNNHEELIQALVDRARSARSQGLTESALADYERVRGMTSGYKHRTWGMEMMVDLLIDLGQEDRAREVIAQLRSEGVSAASYCDWLEARLLLTRGDLAEGLDIVRRIDRIQAASGTIVPPALLLDARYKACLALELYDEAAVCLIQLMAGQGRIADRSGEMLLALWGSLPREALVQMLIEADRGYLDQVVAHFRTFPGGKEIAQMFEGAHLRS
ncbi:Glycosyl transferase family 2 [Austwickia chelonae]|uniref:Glycosyltransferase 2-like domain-containing protein n=1 Tax=Austwickia chelonae NBRC 105200 TaxID=1184607 RepID=K6VB37_9MICO|nr:glycosyltransferase family 2 protein [Austwickia chelonae]GAB79458.1 hypothetical protein AUCHE_26_00090 [Austwickia chelonae NBRC 105200]SEW44220.1 Glycosyl transferase family 2 [Austwickia chelonae]